MSVFFYPCNWCRLKEEELSMVINLEYSVKQLHPFGHQNTRKIIITQQYLLYTRTFRASASDILDNNGPTLSNCPTFEDVRKKLTQKRGVCLSVCVWCLFVSEVQPGVVKGLLGVLRSLCARDAVWRHLWHRSPCSWRGEPHRGSASGMTGKCFPRLLFCW